MTPQRGVVCLVTDRRRLGGPSADAFIQQLQSQIAAAIDAGVDLVQIRERDLDAAALSRLVTAAVRRAEGSPARVLVNDRLDVALACGAHGVHLRSDSIAPAEARSIAPAGFLVGRSVHSVREAAELGPHVDYLIAGTVFPTPSKPGVQTTLGTAGLTAIVQASGAPVLGIGGLTMDRISDLVAAGAAGLAAIGLFAGSARPFDLRRTVSDIRLRFDSAPTRS